MKKLYSGLTRETKERLLLDSGAFFKNFEVGTDTYATAVAGGKLLGATSGGGEFNAVATYRSIEVDGAIGEVKGLKDIERWDVNIKAKLLEVTPESIAAALGAAVVDDSDENYVRITGRGYVADEDYVENITWVGCLSGNENPVIIQVYNGLSDSGFKFTPADKSNAVLEANFIGHYEPTEVGASFEPPFDIYYPKKQEE